MDDKNQNAKTKVQNEEEIDNRQSQIENEDGESSFAKASEDKELLLEEKNRRLQLLADFENYKKRVENERATFGAIANMQLIQDLLEISDDLGMAMADETLDLERSKAALKTASDKLTGAASKAGVEKIEVKIGDEFNKEIMEAVSVVPDEKNKGKVIAVISSAYKYAGSDQILKHAKVIVGK